VLDLCKRAVDPQMVFTDGALDDTSFRQFFADRPGAQLKMASSNFQWGRDARYVDPPPLPQLFVSPTIGGRNVGFSSITRIYGGVECH